ncbi:plasma protease C1 inhibitor-like protein [Lates japonicus]|uniref:Plasma protease C1 inhibitor-like protein n=1 Tax=Lates japonicus TaxID=270547 RepID=A0AAD3RFC7_LATJO|nr:plasma protease C1 inhibitor-like protein [Lates japonicus]
MEQIFPSELVEEMRLQAVLCILLQLIFELSSCTHLRVIPGSTLELPCLSFQSDFSAATITWQFNGKDISEHPYGSVTVKKDGLYLSISPVTAANEGNYVCVMKDDQVEMIRMYNITVDASIGYTIKVIKGSYVRLPCNFPPGSQVVANALWFRETDDGRRMMLNPQDEENNKLELLYPFDHDQTLILRDTAMDDAGIYTCESTDGKKLSTVYIIVEVPPTETPHTCEGFTTPWEPCQDQNSRTGEPMLQESMAEFSMKLYSYLRQSDPSGNLLFSPISISGALSHLLLGARDNTRKAIERAVCVPHEFHCVHFQMKKLRERMASSLQMASQIFYNPQMNLSESFTNQSIQFYDVEPTRLLENSEENTRMINSWVANKTKNKITQLVDSVSPSTQLILLNAVSFSGQWKVKFDEKQKKGHFTKLNGDMVKVPVLFHHKYMAAMMYVVELKAQVARFALSGDSSLYILLPRSSKAADLQQVEEKMTDTAVRQMIEQMKTTPPQQIEVTLPQIKLDVQPDMNLLIKKLGLSSLFENPNLCGLYSEDKLLLDDARHRAFLTLTKQGVEAGAITTMSFSRTFPSFSAMRPFIMLLWSDQANVPLFIGRVTDP